MKKKYYVYKHLYKKKAVYIGKGTVDYRLKKSIGGRDSRAYAFNRRSKEYLDFIKDVGKENIEVQIIARFDSEEDALWLEEELHKVYKNLFSKVLKGEDNPFYGRHHSKQIKEKLRVINIGKQISEETKNKMSESSPNKKSIVCLDTNEIFKSITIASKKYKIDHSSISKCCRGKLKTSGGYRWMFYDEYLELENIA